MRLLTDFLRNPIAVALLAILAGVGATILPGIVALNPVATNVAETFAKVFMTAGTFGILFEYVTKSNLITKSVDAAVGQANAISAGIFDFKKSSSEIKYIEDIDHSSSLIVSTRFSNSFISRHKDALLRRIGNGKRFSIIRVKESEFLSSSPGYRPHQLIEDYIRQVFPNNLKRISVLETERHFNYSFVVVDRGVWIKMYWNSKKQEQPPAFFASRDTSIFKEFMADINDVIKNSVSIPL